MTEPSGRRPSARCAVTRPDGWLGGVCAGIARRWESTHCWCASPSWWPPRWRGRASRSTGSRGWRCPLTRTPPRKRHGTDGARASVEVALGVGFLLLSVLLTFRELGLWFSDALVWPLVLVATGGALLWRQSLGTRPTPAEHAARARTPSGAGAEPRPSVAARARRWSSRGPASE